MGVNDKDFFSKLAGVGPDGKFSDFSNGRQSSDSNLSVQADGTRKNFYKQENGNNNKNKTNLKMDNKDLKINNNDKEEELDNAAEEEGQLAVDVYSTETSFVIESAIAGVKGEDIDVSITIDSITINGKRSKEDKDSDKEYLCQECFWGRFSRAVILPQEIDADRAIASFKNGILKIILPKILRDKSKKLRVRFD
ncbi:MAG: Hsp20/alpha crystallin family protein [Patescibacteria group bacterium]